MHNINTIIFDLGSVLVTVAPTGPKFVALMDKIGIKPWEAFEKFWYASEVRQFMTGELNSHDFYLTVCERFNLDYSFDEFAEGWCDLFKPIPSMAVLFQEISQRYNVGLLSDTDPLHWAAVQKIMPWLDQIAKPTLSFNVGYLKPHPKMFSAAAENCGKKKEECLFIDDSIANIDGARYSGMPGLLFFTSEKLRKDMIGLQIL